MKLNFKRVLSSLLVLLVLCTMVGLTALAGSPAVSFSFAFSEEGENDYIIGQKTDAGTSSGNYATLGVHNCWVTGGTPYVQVKNSTGTLAFTAVWGITETGTYNMPYTVAITNGYLRLYGWSEIGACSISGNWYP